MVLNVNKFQINNQKGAFEADFLYQYSSPGGPRYT